MDTSYAWILALLLLVFVGGCGFGTRMTEDLACADDAEFFGFPESDVIHGVCYFDNGEGSLVERDVHIGSLIKDK